MAGFSVAIASDTRLFEQGVKVGVIDPVENAQESLQELGRAGAQAGDGVNRGLRTGTQALDGLEHGLRDSERALEQVGRAGTSAGHDVGNSLGGTARYADMLARAGLDVGDDIRTGARVAERALDDVGDAGREAGNDLERGLRDAQRETARTGAEYKDLAEEVRRATAEQRASGQHAFDPAAESVETFRDEAVSNLSEVASSFDGSVSSVFDLLQGTLGGVIADLGPLGLAAGTAAAAGVGLIGAAFSQAGEDQEAFKQRVDAMTGELLDEFYEVGDAVTAVDRKLRDWASDNEKYGVSLVDLQKDARTARIGFGDLAETIATGTTPELRRMRGEIEESIDSLRKRAAAVDTTAGADRSAANAAGEQADRLQKELVPAINQSINANKNAAAAEEALASAQGMTVEQYRAYVEQTNVAKQASEDFASTLTGVLSDAAESTSEKLDNGAMNAGDYVKGLEERTAAAQQYASNVRAIGEQLPGDLFNFVRQQGPGFSQEIATYLSASPEQQAAIRAGWKIDAQVTADTSDVEAKTADQSRKKTKGPTSEVKADTSDVDEKVAAKGREKKKGPTSELQADASDVDKAVASKAKQRGDGPTVKLRTDDSAIDRKLSDLAGRVIAGPTVRIRYDSSALDDYLARPRTITVNVRQGQEVK
jgi:hypothetical protein